MLKCLKLCHVFVISESYPYKTVITQSSYSFEKPCLSSFPFGRGNDGSYSCGRNWIFGLKQTNLKFRSNTAENRELISHSRKQNTHNSEKKLTTTISVFTLRSPVHRKVKFAPNFQNNGSLLFFPLSNWFNSHTQLVQSPHPSDLIAPTN